MSAEILKCSVCNNPILPDFKFCPTCGSLNAYYRTKEAAPTPPVAPLSSSEPVQSQNSYPVPATQVETQSYGYQAPNPDNTAQTPAADSLSGAALLDFAALFGYGDTTTQATAAEPTPTPILQEASAPVEQEYEHEQLQPVQTGWETAPITESQVEARDPEDVTAPEAPFEASDDQEVSTWVAPDQERDSGVAQWQAGTNEEIVHIEPATVAGTGPLLESPLDEGEETLAQTEAVSYSESRTGTATGPLNEADAVPIVEQYTLPEEPGVDEALGAVGTWHGDAMQGEEQPEEPPIVIDSMVTNTWQATQAEDDAGGAIAADAPTHMEPVEARADQQEAEVVQPWQGDAEQVEATSVVDSPEETQPEAQPSYAAEQVWPTYHPEEEVISQASPPPVEEQPVQEVEAAQSAQTGPLSFTDLFSWTTDDSQPPTYEPVVSTTSEAYSPPVQPNVTQEAGYTATPSVPPPVTEPADSQAQAIFTYDSSTTHEDTTPQYDAPSWKPGDEDQSAYRAGATTNSQQTQPVWTPPTTPTEPIYQSYSPPTTQQASTTPPTTTAYEMPPPGQRPKPGTPEYEEMARRAMEARGMNATPPQGYATQPNLQAVASYTPPPVTQAPPPVTPAMPPPGQRPKPGTPEYEEMARRAMEERLRQQGGSGGGGGQAISQQATPSQGYSTQSSYTPPPPPPDPPPVTPAMPPPGQRPKPGTPEYEEMARRAMEERLRQQGK